MRIDCWKEKHSNELEGILRGPLPLAPGQKKPVEPLTIGPA